MTADLETVAAEVLQVPIGEISEATSPRNTRNWDSLRHIELMLALEARFSVKFAPSEIVLIGSLGQARDLLRQKGVEI